MFSILFPELTSIIFFPVDRETLKRVKFSQHGMKFQTQLHSPCRNKRLLELAIRRHLETCSVSKNNSFCKESQWPSSSLIGLILSSPNCFFGLNRINTHSPDINGRMIVGYPVISESSPPSKNNIGRRLLKMKRENRRMTVFCVLWSPPRGNNIREGHILGC